MPKPPTSNVIEVDFARSDEEMIHEARSILDRVRSTLDDAAQLERRQRWEHNMLRDLAQARGRRIHELETQLRESQPVTEDSVLETLIDVFEGEPVRAGTLAEHMYDAPMHSTRIRIGHALSRLAEDGRVRRQVHRHCRGCDSKHHSSWAPIRGGDDA
jgi:hypothetical protein